MSSRYAALLRGVNVGGKNRIAMPVLAQLFSDAGARDVETYIQSGNVVFTANAKTAQPICSKVTRGISFQTHIVLRSQSELQRIESANPYQDPDKTYVMFVADLPLPERIALLDQERSVPDEFTICGSDIYLYLPNGVADSKLTNVYFDSKLKTISTMRNWKTLQKLLAMMAG
jgi:uncharacterized protein (DUF1697 family)